jgi:hypothetical protein
MICENLSKQTKSQTLIRLYLFWENWTLRNPKPDHLVFVTSSFWLEFLLPWSFSALPPFFVLETSLGLQIFEISSFLGLRIKLSKLDYLE